tara:strand:+ start:1471 stop:2868 length:1398 start_codon:yes stop_codon:yes gene_type:complete
MANYLLSLGLRPGDRVSAQVEKSPECMWLFLAVIRAGFVFHPLNTAYTDEELDFFLRDAEPSLMVCEPARRDNMQSLCETAGVGHLRTLGGEDADSLMFAAAQCEATFVNAATAASDVAALVYSSGTTGRPKGIMLTHGNLVSNASTLAGLWGFGPRDCLLHALPVYHVHGLFVALGCVLMSGASMRWLANFRVDAVLSALPGCTVMMGVPTYYTRLLASDAFGVDQCRNMRLFVSGSAPLAADTWHEFERRSGHRILERYGMTETGMNTSNPLSGERRPGTVGLPLPGVELRICDQFNKVLPAGEVGDIQVRGPNVFCGYWKLPEKTAEEFTTDGYFVTGDKGVIDVDGYVSIVGRSKDMVITGGLNVYPKEVEVVIDALPGVLESAVIGLPDDDFGESVAAVVVPDGSDELDAEAIRVAVRARIAGYKVPKAVFLIDELPRNAMGKVRKDALRDRYAEGNNTG